MVTPVENGTRPVQDILNSRFQELASELILLGSGVPTGTTLPWGSATPPSGWIAADGSAVSRTTYAAIFALVGTLYGNGDGSTTFNLPDLRGRYAMGRGAGAGLDARTLGQQVGEDRHQLIVDEIPAHNHTLIATGGSFARATGAAFSNNGGGLHDKHSPTAALSGTTGTDTPHENMQPFLGMNWIIRT